MYELVLKRKQFIFGVLFCLGVKTIYSFIKTKSFRKPNQSHQIYAGVELGGTNFNVAIGKPVLNNKGQLVDFDIQHKINRQTSKNPQQTINEITNYINNKQPNPESKYTFVGLASFGPLCLEKGNISYGNITTTPKQQWKNVSLLRQIQNNIQTNHIQIDTDVNAAAYAQFRLGKRQLKQSLAYITVGTGVGVGFISQGKTVHGMTHPEAGHTIVQRSVDEYPSFNCVCDKHTNCVQGFVNNKAISLRMNQSIYDLHRIEDDESVWKLVGFYLAQLCMNITLICSPEVIVLGGGIMNRQILYGIIREQFMKLLNQYIEHPKYTEKQINQYIVAPTLGANVGVKGAMILNFMNNK